MKAVSLLNLMTVLGALNNNNFSTGFDRKLGCLVSDNLDWPSECKGIMVEHYQKSSGDFHLNYSIPTNVFMPGEMNITQCTNDDSCSCNCNCTVRESKFMFSFKKQKDSFWSPWPHHFGCYQFVAHHEGHVLSKSCCAYFPDSDIVLTEILEDTTPSFSPKMPPQNTGVALIVPVISSLAVIFIIVCVIAAGVIYYKRRVHSSELHSRCVGAAADCSVSFSTSLQPAIKILLVHMYDIREFKHEVKVLQANLVKNLKCTVVDVSDCEGAILDVGCIEQFMNDFHKVLVIFPRDSPSIQERASLDKVEMPPSSKTIESPFSQQLDRFYSCYLHHRYPDEKILAVSLERFFKNSSDLCAGSPRVYTIPTQLQNLVQDLNSSCPANLLNELDDCVA